MKLPQPLKTMQKTQNTRNPNAKYKKSKTQNTINPKRKIQDYHNPKRKKNNFFI